MPPLPPVKWTVIALTCQNKDSADAFQHELETRQQKGLIHPDTVLLTVEDPKSCVGSGGATLNALLVATEHLGARQGHMVVTADVLQDARVLIMHMGRLFPFDPCGRAFLTTALRYTSGNEVETLVSNFDLLLHTMTHKVAVNSPPGLWVCSTDMFLEIPAAIDASSFAGHQVCVVAVPSSIEYATQHGVYRIDKQGFAQDIVFHGSEEQVRTCMGPGGDIPLVSGVLYFSETMAEHLLSLHTVPPLDACTYMGLDSGAQPIELSIFFDFLLAMFESVSEEEYVTGARSGRYGTQDVVKGEKAVIMHNARALLRKKLQGTKVKAIMVPNGQHRYMTTEVTTHHRNLLFNPVSNCPDGPWEWRQATYSTVQEEDVGELAVVINSVIEPGVKVPRKTVVSHSHLTSKIHLGQDSVITGIIPTDYQYPDDTYLSDSILLQAFHVRLPVLGEDTKQRVLTLLGKFDDLKMPMHKGESSYCGFPWVVLLNRTGITEEDLWPSAMEIEQKCLFNARLFPVAHIHHTVKLHDLLWLSGNENDNPEYLQKWRSSWRLTFEEILSMVNLTAEFSWRRKQFFTVAEDQIRRTLLEHQASRLSSLYKAACIENYDGQILDLLDNVAIQCQSPGIAARTLANIADVLGSKAHGKGGMRSGPAANHCWSQAFRLLDKEDIVGGVQALAAERRQWLGRPDLLVRAARHYEGAAAILIKLAVLSARTFIKTEPAQETPAVGEWVIVECAARADLAGGWSDTPPITYEHGGAVTNVALIIDGKKPIGAKARRIPELNIVLNIMSDGHHGTTLTLTKLSQLSNYSQPHAPGALLKAALCCAEIIEFPSEESLPDQLRRRYSSGLEVHSWSNLPHGSGLGTSSILAGALMAALWKASGRSFTVSSLTHAVLHLEQMLTTGGGWQDQVGGLYGGFKVGYSPASLPLQVCNKPLNVSSETIQAFQERFILVYTGTTRLARNLLQNVVRNWYARDPEIVKTEDNLVKVAWELAAALEKGNLEEVGDCLDQYWILKKVMAPGCEPSGVTHMIQALRPYISGTCMAGAGGGGFLYLLMKEPQKHDFVRNVIQDLKTKGHLGQEHVTIHECSVDVEGYSLRIEPGQK